MSRRQLIAAGTSVSDLRRLVRRRELVAMHAGVYVDHTGPRTWLQRAWAAVLYAWPSALCSESALRAAEGPGRADAAVIHVAIDLKRRVRATAGVEIHRQTDLDEHVLWNVGPPRLRYEQATIDVALAASTDLDAIAVIARACGGRRTTARRLAADVGRRSRVARRAWLTAVLTDVADGTSSVLEHGYLTRVERAHGLPSALRQVRAVGSAGTLYRDAEVGSLVIELDGRLFHDSASARDRDMERDLDAALDGSATVRLGWGQVFERSCSTASKVGALLAVRGWRGVPRPCGPGCMLEWNVQVTG